MSQLAKDSITIPCNIKHETDKAILISYCDSEGDLQKAWFPLSQIHEIHRKDSVTEGQFTDSIVCSKWIAAQKGVLVS